MIFKPPGEPTRVKKAVYLFASTILGVLLSFIAHGLIEISYLNWAISRHQVVVFYGGCALLPVFQTGILAVGIVGGFFLGRFWWQKIYVEKVWRGSWRKK